MLGRFPQPYQLLSGLIDQLAAALNALLQLLLGSLDNPKLLLILIAHRVHLRRNSGTLNSIKVTGLHGSSHKAPMMVRR